MTAQATKISASSLPDETRIAGQRTVRDWLALRRLLIKDPTRTDKWTEAYAFFRERVDSRFIAPIKSVLAIDKRAGEGHSAMALQCVLLEFLEALNQGKLYRTPIPADAIARKAESLVVTEDLLKSHVQPHAYHSSASLFSAFLTSHEPFSSQFDKPTAARFYTDVRCGLLHEAATKSGSLVHAQKEGDSECLIDRTDNRLIVYRNAFHKALLQWLESYKQRLITEKTCQANFLRKMDNIAQINRCLYFAYGSNMNKSWLFSRIPHAHDECSAKCNEYSFHYNKKSDDGSMKANISRCPGANVWGVCYEIDECDFQSLHERYEKGYDVHEVWINNQGDSGIIAKTFQSQSVGSGKPTPEYMQRILDGAQEHGLPEEYINTVLKAA